MNREDINRFVMCGHDILLTDCKKCLAIRNSALEAANAALKLQIAGDGIAITSGNAVMAEQVRMIEDLRGRIAELEAKAQRLQWQPITPENLPNRGDEALEMGTDSHGARVIPVGFDSREGDCERYTHAGFTHFRPINPPAKEQP